MKVHLSVALLATALSVGHRALSCSCYTPDTVSAPELRAQAFLFQGLVTAREAVPTGDPASDQYFMRGSITTFQVETIWRGPIEFSQLKVFSGFPGSACGFVFEPGTRYLVFGHLNADGRLETSTCSRTAPLPQAESLHRLVVKVLGKGRTLPPDR